MSPDKIYDNTYKSLETAEKYTKEAIESTGLVDEERKTLKKFRRTLDRWMCYLIEHGYV